MQKTKATFRAIRELCGMTQSDVADEFDVDVRSVKRWESESVEGYEPPDAVWAFLLECAEELEQEAREAVAAVKSMDRGDAPIAMTYYRTQEELDSVQLAAGLDRSLGYANAITRRIMQLLHESRIEFDIYYPDQMELVDPQSYKGSE